MNNDLIATFISRFGDEVVLTGDKLKARGSGYLDSSPLKARALLRPRNTSEIIEILSLCNAAKQSVVPHGGLTNLVYNTRTTEKDVIISLEMMNKIEEVDIPNGTMIVQAGATLQSRTRGSQPSKLVLSLDLAGACLSNRRWTDRIECRRHTRSAVWHDARACFRFRSCIGRWHHPQFINQGHQE